jgi:ribonuclease R
MGNRLRDWRDEILRFLQANPERRYKVKDLQRALRVPATQYGAFRKQVLALAHEARIASYPRRRFQALARATLLEGRVEGIGARATHVSLTDGTRMPLYAFDHGSVVPGDRVRVRRVREEGVTVAQIQRILSAAPREVFGCLERVGDRWVVVPDRRVPGLAGGLFVGAEVRLDAGAEGQITRARVPAFDPASARPEVRELEVLGAADHPRAAMARRIAEAAWPSRFSPQAEAEALAGTADDRARRDLTAALVFTIDPLDAKDHDDAVSIERTPSGGYRLGVHIADVASHVREGGPIDREARERATSVYPPGFVLPMIPASLSSGECSLHEGVARRCITVEIEYDEQATRRTVAIGRSRIRSRATLAYEHAEAMLDPATEAPDEPEGEAPASLRRSLGNMLELARRLRQRRRAMGSLFVDRPERVFTFAADGHVAAVGLRPDLRSHWIIEEFMLEANRAVAETLHAADLPLLWRIHEAPDETKIDELVELLAQLGVGWAPREPVGGHDYGELFARVEGRPEASLIHLLALRSLMKARYHAGGGGHFGLAFEQYTHFTSPIRRYPDLHNQRWLQTLIDAVGTEGWMDDALTAAARAPGQRLASGAARRAAESLADHCSRMEREGMHLERDCEDICAADSLRAREGESLAGMVVSVVPSGLFVEIDGTGMDGFVGVERLPGDWYTFSERRHGFVGQRTGRLFRLGQRVQVLLEHVDVASGRLWLGSIQPVTPR